MKDFNYAKGKTNKKKKFKMPVLNFYDGKYCVPIILLPLGLIIIAKDRMYLKYVKHLKWEEAKASKVLDCFLPYVLDYNEDENAYYYYTGWRYNGVNLSRHAPLGMKIWSKKYYRNIFNYLNNEYQKEGYVKTFEEEWHERWIVFTPKDN